MDIELSRENNPFDQTHMMSMTDLVAIIMETIRIYYRCSLDKEFIELIHLNP